jgi:hypothetical protein
MVGDYISTSWLGNRAYGVFAVGRKPTNGKAFDEGTFVPTGGLNRTRSTRSAGGASVGIGGRVQARAPAGSAVRRR